MIFFFFQQKTAYEMRSSDWSSDVCSSDLINTPTPFGNIGTGSEARAKRVSDTELYPDFIGLSDIHPRINGGAHFVGPNGDFMLSDDGLDRLRAIYNLPAGQPADDPLRQFDADERTYARYGPAQHGSEARRGRGWKYVWMCVVVGV